MPDKVMPDKTRRVPRPALGLAALGLVAVVAIIYFALGDGHRPVRLGGEAPAGSPSAPDASGRPPAPAGGAAAPATPAAPGVAFAAESCEFAMRFPGPPSEERIVDRRGNVELPVVVAAYVDRPQGVYYRIDCTVLGQAAAGLSSDELLARQLVSLLEWGENSHLSNIEMASEDSPLGQRARLHGTTTTRQDDGTSTVLVVDAIRYTAPSSALHIVTLVPQSLYPLDSATRFLDSVSRRAAAGVRESGRAP